MSENCSPPKRHSLVPGLSTVTIRVMECWAAQLGGCSNKQSCEHYISEGLWKNPALRVRGFPWLSGGEKDLPLSLLTAKILCTEHNQRLSPLDSEAIRLFKWLDEIWRLQEVRRKLGRTKFWTVKRYSVNGTLFERWAAKTAIGLCCAFDKNLHWKQTGSPCNQPPVEILEAVYGENIPSTDGAVSGGRRGRSA